MNFGKYQSIFTKSPSESNNLKIPTYHLIFAMLLGVYALSSSFLSKQYNILKSIDDTKSLICHILLNEFGPQGGYTIRKASLIFGGRIPHLGLGWAYRPPPPAQVRMAPLLRNVLEGNL